MSRWNLIQSNQIMVSSNIGLILDETILDCYSILKLVIENTHVQIQHKKLLIN